MENEVKNMEPIKVIVVDDEPRCVLGLVEQLGKLPDFEVVATSYSPKTAIELIIKLNPDVVFLDVEMPKMTGFDVLQELRGKVSEDMMVVFYTAFDKYMIDALRASAFDFLLKPYEEGEFKKVLARIRERMEQLRSNPLAMIDTGLSDRMLALDNLMSRKVAIQTVSGLVMLNPQEVFSFTFLDDARIWVLKLADGTEYPLKKQTTSKQIMTIAESLVQVRQDVIINLDYLMGIENHTLRCLFAPPLDKEEILVSRRYFKSVKDKLDIL